LSSLPNKVLVANRGEVAVRVLRALRDLGLPSVAVCTAADRLAPHVRLADEVVALDDASRGYLDVAAMIDAARTSGARAIHPGYGFLAECPEFREACDAAGIRFIGPPARAMRAMAHKLPARDAMARAGLPIVPGSAGAVPDAATARQAAAALGYPVLLKAAAGGGGRGMRRVEGPEAMAAAFDAAAREAMGAFGCPTLFVEKALPGARHIEIQVLADGHGNAVHLYERCCSVQRRHQKVIEEAPAPALSRETVDALCRASLDAVRALGYEGAGTLEFLVDGEERFHFMEMNTRLQVEHAITETILGVDLVQAMIRVGMGEPVPWRQEDLVPRGHAVECRVYAEDPHRDFAPSPGRLFRYRPPAGPFVRVDDGIEEGAEVCACFDPLLAKVVAWGADRPDAIARMRGALREFEIGGVRHNLPLLAHVLASEAFVSGRYDTGLLDRIGATPAVDVVAAEEMAVAAAARAMCGTPARAAVAPPAVPSRWRSRRAWRGLD
jgi:acetyl/propionyl-CoA carboxylase alpha subunit